jgi:putative aldouronate transport system substrate-binding protein
MTKNLSRREFLRAAAAASAGASVLAACSPKTDEPEEQPTPQPTATTAAAAPTATTAPAEGECKMDWNPTWPTIPNKMDPPIEVSTTINPRQDLHAEGWSWDNNPLYDAAVEHTGLKLVMHWDETAGGDAYGVKISADLAAGTLPDYFRSGGIQLEELIDEGAIQDIKAIWDREASPLVKEKKGYPDFVWWKQTVRDGKVWGIPFTYGPARNVDNIPFIRQDWLDQLGLEAPTTVEGWGETAKAFQDAGLCEFGISACMRFVTWYQSLDPIFGAYGVMPTCWIPDGAGGLKYDSVSPGVKDALAVLRGWYEDGLIDPDFYTLGEGPAAAHIPANKIGIFTAPWWHGGGQVRLEEENPGMRIEPFDYPTGPGGKQGRKTSGLTGNVTVFRAGLSEEAITACIHNLNWHMEWHVNWEKYQQYGAWRNDHAFLEGYDWEWDENCELKDGPFPMPNTYIWQAYTDFGFVWGIYPDYQIDVFRDMGEWLKKDPSELNKAQRFILSNPVPVREQKYYSRIYDTTDIEIANEYWGNPSDRYREVWPDLSTLENETMINIVVGNEDLDYFDDFVKDWKETGGDEVTAEVSKWYQDLQG